MSYTRTITLITNNTPVIPVSNEVYLVDGSSGPAGITGTVLRLPNIVSDGMSFIFRRIDDTSPVVTIGATGGQLINGNPSITLPNLSDTEIQSYEGNWYTVHGINQSIGTAGLPINLRFTQSNGNGFESSSNQWLVCGYFVYRGISVDGVFTIAKVIAYTRNSSTWHRWRIFNRTNNTQIAITTQTNLGTLVNPIIVNFGPVTNLPTTQSIFEVQLLATNAGGGTNLSGRQIVGIDTFQIYG